MTKTLRTLLAAAAALACAPLTASATDVTRTQLSDNAVPDGKPRVSGNRVVWQRNADATGEIVTWTPADGTDDVTSNALRDFDPELSGDYAIWKRSIDGGSCSLQTWDFDTIVQIVSSFDCQDDISVAGPHIGWADDGIGFFDDVFVSTDLDDVEQIGTRDVDEGFIRVGNVAGNPRAFWIDEEDIRYWNGSTETSIAPRPPTEALRGQLRVHGARAVWADEDPDEDDLEIFVADGASVEQLTENDYDDETPAIHGNDVVWVGFPDGGAEGEIFHDDGTTTEQVTDDDLDDFDPQVSSGADGVTIAWVKTFGDDEIWVNDGCESAAITDDSTDDGSVALDGNRVAWVRGSGTSSEVWTASFECNVVCGDLATQGDEECDDGNTISGDGCSADCLAEVCSNLRIDFGEECDDGNTVGGDGCDSACQLECGNGMPDTGEQCDDGNRDNADGCDENCVEEICGNDVLQTPSGEECDDGNTVADDGCSAVCENEDAAPIPVQRCIAKLNERGAAVAKAQHAVNALCLKSAAKGALPVGVPTAQACLAADPKTKVAKAQAKTLSVEAAKCDPGELPNFAYEGGAVVNAAAVAQPIGLVEDLFGADLDAAVRPKLTDKPGARCQKNVLGATQQLSNSLFKAAFKEKKLLLAGKEDGTLARSDAVLAMLLSEFLLADASGKIAAQEANVRTQVRTSCTQPILDAAFPGCAPSATLNEMASCAIAAARCRFCVAFNAFDGIAMDCETFDDDLGNASCP
jgi:cysteine-rich repeat protein